MTELVFADGLRIKRVPSHPMLPEFAGRELDLWKQGEVTGLTILLAAHGEPWKATLLSQYMRAALLRLGPDDGLGVHGLRKMAAAQSVNAGCSAHEIASITATGLFRWWNTTPAVPIKNALQTPRLNGCPEPGKNPYNRRHSVREIGRAHV